MKRDDYDSLRREYARLAEQYDSRWQYYVDASIRQTLARLDVERDNRVLDVGCGTGEFLATLLRVGGTARLAGVDLSHEMLAVAEQNLGQEVTLKQASAEALPFADAAFDTVVSTNVFHFIRQPKTALREISRVLVPDGRVVITDWCDDYLACRLCDLFLRYFSPGHFRTYGARQCAELLSEAGFVDVDVTRYRISWLWGLMTATGHKRAAREGH